MGVCLKSSEKWRKIRAKGEPEKQTLLAAERTAHISVIRVCFFNPPPVHAISLRFLINEVLQVRKPVHSG